MLTHAQIWTALDRLAAAAGLSPSGLAKKSGLDPTTFNKSKRTAADGRQRWPSTESVAKALAATGTAVETFVQMMEETGPSAVRNTLPLIGLAQAGQSGYFDETGFPSGAGWEEIRFPAINDGHAYALEVSGNALAPVYQEGTFLLVSPAASIRRGDRVVVKTTDHVVTVNELRRRTAKTIELRSIASANIERALAVREVLWLVVRNQKVPYASWPVIAND
jgi:phage repressor protein C with HTH and peptisase S24 domain